MTTAIRPEIKTTHPNIRSDIRALIKLLIGDDDQSHLLPYRLEPDDLAQDMKQEGYVLAAIYWCSTQAIPPTQANVIAQLEIRNQLSDPRAFVETLIRDHAEDVHGLRALAAFIHEWLQERQLAAQGEAIARIANSPELGYDEKWEKAFDLVTSVPPDSSFVYEGIGEREFKMLLFKRNQETLALLRAGQEVGVRLPFGAADAYLAPFQWGEATLIVGREGTGKSSVGSIIAEAVARNVKLNCDVVYFALETPLDVFSARAFARNTVVPLKAINDRQIDLASEQWKPRWEAWLKQEKDHANAHSYMRYFYSPEASATEIIAQMRRTAEASRACGRKIVWIIDHLHSIDWERTHKRMGEFDALRAITRQLMAAANRISTRVDDHLIILAQEGDARGQMFGGKFAAKRAQYVFTIQRSRFGEPDDEGNYPLASEDLPVIVPASELTPEQRASGRYLPTKADPNKYLALDALGRPRYWYRKGDEYTHEVSLRITKANDDRLGVIKLLFEASINRIVQDPAQVAQLRADGLLLPLGK